MKYRALVWIALLIAASLWSAWQLNAGAIAIDADYLAFVDSGENAASGLQATHRLLTEDNRRALFVVGHDNHDTARQQARDFIASLKALPQTAAINSPVADSDDRGERLLKHYAAHGGGLLSRADRRKLENGQARPIYERALAEIYAPAAMTTGAGLRADPFRLLPAFLRQLQERSAGFDRAIKHNGRSHVPISVRLDEVTTAQRHDWAAAVTAAIDRVHDADAATQILHTGPLFFARAEENRARQEVRRIALLSTAGIVLLALAVFLSWLPVAGLLITIGGGLLAGLTAAVTLMDTIHVIALVFGSSLIGISVDYAFHYFAVHDRLGDGYGNRRLRRILPGLTLGLLTSLIGFAALAVTPAALLTQIAVFSAFGLAGAYLTVVCLLPLLPERGPAPWLHDNPGLMQLVHRHRRLFQRNSARYALLAVWFIGLIALPWWLQPDDDVRVLGYSEAQLVSNSETIQAITGQGGRADFLLIEAADTQTALQLEETIRERLTPLIERGQLGGLIAIADFIPSLQRQRDNRQLVAEKLHAPYADELAAAIGNPVTPPDTDELLRPDRQTLALWPQLDTLLVAQQPGTHLVRLQGMDDADAVDAALADLAGAQRINPVAVVNNALAGYRVWAYVALLLLLAGAAVLLVSRYGRRHGLLTLLAPASGVLLALLATPLLGVTHNFFTTMALFLVFAIGADYAIFLRESHADAFIEQTYLAVLLSLASSLLTFGLLASSRIPLVHDLGLVIVVGLTAAWLCATLSLAAHPDDKEHNPS
ncbi:putative exporter [Methylohalomonas lacus]|uniref:Exporter n=1 Tax=Methylohalomonas lacus TaxID=398773 RepID=A0AAE3HJH4_9GAMM|nr:MMPL family transporter [Methylohalomonas lacus]MCS3902358.1 putative exporter [Methylohalomonas lacus]